MNESPKLVYNNITIKDVYKAMDEVLKDPRFHKDLPVLTKAVRTNCKDCGKFFYTKYFGAYCKVCIRLNL